MSNARISQNYPFSSHGTEIFPDREYNQSEQYDQRLGD